MKRISLLSVLFLAFTAITFTSCGDTEPIDPVLTPGEGSGGTPGAAVFKVDFSGSTYVATSTIATISDGLITIGGIKGTNGQMVSVIVQGTAAGTYSGEQTLMDYNPGNSEYSYSNLFVAGNDAGSVTINTIDTTNHVISGTFHFVGAWSDADANMPSVAFTNGSFENIPYTGNVPGGGGTDPVGDEFFKAKINGTMTSFSSHDAIVTSDFIQINAINNIGAMNSESIGLTMNLTIAAGTYPVADFPDQGIVANYSKGVSGYIASEGAVTIISNANGTIKGTFYFSGSDIDGEPGPVITEGSFSVNY